MLNEITLRSPAHILLPCLALMSAACVVQHEGSAEEEGEELGTAELALCGSVALSPDASVKLKSSSAYDVATAVSGTSPTSTYGSAECPGSWVYDVLNTTGQPNLTVRVEWLNNQLTPAECADGQVQGTVYGWNGTSWNKIDDMSDTGAMEWWFDWQICKVDAEMSVPSTFSKIRVAGRAIDYTGLFPRYRPVTIGAMARW